MDISITYNDTTLNIEVDIKSETFKDPSLGTSYFNSVIRDLLFYKSMNFKFSQITMNIDAININYNILYVNPRVDKYCTINNMFIGE
jgi:hypothetical protein